MLQDKAGVAVGVAAVPAVVQDVAVWVAALAAGVDRVAAGSCGRYARRSRRAISRTGVGRAVGSETIKRCDETMKLAIASGKGGTGKTTVAVNLAWTLAGMGRRVQYLDCDVEEPNGHIFLKPEIKVTEPVGIPVPVVDESKCDGCRKCA